MSVTAVTHPNFRSEARAALAFSRAVSGGTRRWSPGRRRPGARRSGEVGQVVSPGGFRVMAHGVPPSMPWQPGEDAFFVSVRGEDAGEIIAYGEGLGEGAEPPRPLGPAPGAPCYGMLRDAFKVTWVPDVAAGHGA